MDVSHTIEAKSDQLNADDLIGGPVVVKIMGAKEGAKDQPVILAIATADRGLQPWKPCKTMRRLLVALWGKDASKWVGHFVRLYRDGSVRWAGAEVGGIRLDAADIDRPIEVMLTVTRGNKQPFKVVPLPKEIS